MASQLQLRLFYSKNSTTGNVYRCLKAVNISITHKNRLCAVCGFPGPRGRQPITNPVTTTYQFLGLIDRMFTLSSLTIDQLVFGATIKIHGSVTFTRVSRAETESIQLPTNCQHVQPPFKPHYRRQDGPKTSLPAVLCLIILSKGPFCEA